MKIGRVPVKSSNVKSVGYSAKTKTLHVEFTNGGVYEYGNVPSEKYAALRKAKSIGGYLAASIKGKHTHKKL